MVEWSEFLLSGLVFGLVAGISPGPLLTLVISETLKHNKKEGVIVASAPLFTDIPIVLVSVFVLSKLSDYSSILGIISILGALFLMYLAYESISIRSVKLDLSGVKSQSLKKGIVANALSPHPYAFWVIVGAPTVVKAYSASLLSASLFLLGFYVLLVGSKVGVAMVVDRSKDFLSSKFYVYAIRFLGVVLLVYALLFAKDGIRYFGFL